MGYTNSGLVAYKKLSPNHSGQRTHSIDRITPHCVVGQCTAEGLGDWFAKSSTQASSNYGIDKDGRVGLYVEEKNRSWCSSSNANDQRAVTIECASDTTEPYAFRDAVYKKLITLCVDICKRNGKKKLLWFGDKDKTLNYSPKSDEMVLTVHRWFANKSCIPVDSEVLTKDGWVKLRDIQIGDEIACADLENLRITFEEVFDKVPERDQDTYTNNGFTATKDHRCVYRGQYQDEYRIDNYKHLLASGQSFYIPLAGYAENEGINLTDDELRFLVAVQADGHYMHEKRTPDDRYTGLEFHLKKERKIQRIKELLKSCHFEYNENYKSDGSVSIRIYGKDIVEECEKHLTDKCFNWSWLQMSRHQAEVFLDELLLWDGCTAANLYTSKQQVNLDVVSAVAALNGYGSNVSGSNIQFRQEPFITFGRDEESTKRNNRRGGTDKTRVSCVSVKTGIFLIRQNGKTFITGNCPGNWMYARMGDLASKVTAQLGGSSDTDSSAPTTSGGTNTKFPAVPFLVTVIIDDLNIRTSGSMSGKVVGQTGKGVFTITKVQDGWGKLKSGAGWIYLENASYCTIGKTVSSGKESPQQGEKPEAEEKKEKVTGLQATALKNLSEEDVIKKIGSLFTADQKKSGIMASVSLAQFILESGYGKSELAQNANNCFGMKKSLSGNTWSGSTWDGKSVYTKQTKEQNADGSYVTITADFRKYPCVEDSIADHSAYLLGAMNGSKQRYAGLKGCKDYKKAAQIIKDGGYATSLTYVDKLCDIISRWNLTQFDVKAEATTPAIPATEEKVTLSATHAKYINSTGTHYISNSGHDENNAYRGGQAGDQTGTEWQMRSWYNRPWTMVLRYPDQSVALLIARLGIDAALNDKIGYDQGQNRTYLNQLKAVGWEPSKITTPCEADCSAGVCANVTAAGYLLGIPALQTHTGTYTGNMKNALVKAGFKALTDSKYLTGGDYLLPGDILLNENHHTATNVTIGSKVKKDWNPTASTPTDPVAQTKYYRVRKSWEDKASQIGAYTVLENAILAVDANPGYAAFDDDGKQVYPKASAFTKYPLSETQLLHIARLCKQEQGTVAGAKAEASLMANQLETSASRREKYGTDADGLYNWVRNGGWFAKAAHWMDNGSVSDAILAGVKDVLVNGNRTLPLYVDEHDCFTDIQSISTGSVKDRSAYVQGKTVVKNKYGSNWTFWCFPDSTSDPFGYTSAAYKAAVGEEQKEPEKTTQFPYLVRISITDLNYRKGPSTSYETCGYIEPGVYTIVDEKDGWGLLKAYADKRDGWISLKYATRI